MSRIHLNLLIHGAALFPMLCDSLAAHEWHRHASPSAARRTHTARPSSTQTPTETKAAILPSVADEKTVAVHFQPLQSRVRLGAMPEAAKHFAHFENVKVRWNDETLFVESNGLPDHNMMVGIRAWQQQVPLPQPFSGSNAWRIPLHPQLAARSINARHTSFRGAIAVAVNGVPIFSALNNRGEDAYLAGELDNWGGHCGRGDDYHYHIAPLHLEEIVGKGNPIAFALDGFPIYGLTEADGSAVGQLDELNGQFDADGNYHYHATKTYPYINGGVRGVVDFRNGEIASQPRDAPVRPGMPPLRGAVITQFATENGVSKLTYRLGNRTGRIEYVQQGKQSFKFTYHQPNGRTYSEVYQRRSRPDNQRRSGRQPPPPPRN